MDNKSKATIEHWLQSQRARPQARPMRSAGYVANRLVRPMQKTHGKSSTVGRVAASWNEFAGRYAKLSKPLRVIGTKDRRTLVIEAAGPAASLIAADSGNILARINAKLGAESFTDLRVQQTRMKVPQQAVVKTRPVKRGLTPSEETQLQSRLSGMEESPLKAALESLGRNVIARDTHGD